MASTEEDIEEGPMSEMPPEIILEFFSFFKETPLNDREKALYQILRTRKQWGILVLLTSSLMKTIPIEYNVSKESVINFLKMVNYNGISPYDVVKWLTTMNIHSMKIDDDLIDDISKYVNLTRLSAFTTHDKLMTRFFQGISNMENLENLKIRGLTASINKLYCSSFQLLTENRKLTTLKIRLCEVYTMEDIRFLWNLTNLTIENSNFGEYSDTFEAPSVKILKMSMCNDFRQNYAFVRSFVNLESIWIKDNGISYSVPIDLTVLSSMKNLKDVKLENSSVQSFSPLRSIRLDSLELDTIKLIQVPSLSIIENLSSLETLIIVGSIVDENDDMVNVQLNLTSLPNLKNTNLK